MMNDDLTKGRRRRSFSQSVTIHDVGRLAGVSAMTVSRFFKASGRVAAPTRAKIKAAVETLNYAPNLVAGTLASNISQIVAVVVPSLSNSIFAETLQALEAELRKAGLNILIGHSDYSLNTEEELVRTFLAHRPAALVLTGYTHSSATVKMLKTAGLPVVEMWNLTKTPIDMNVGMSSFDAAYQMTTSLLTKGYGNVGYIGGHLRNNDRTSQREAGFKKALGEHGIKFHKDMIVRTDFEFSKGGEALHLLLGRRPETRAVFAASDILAIGVMLRCHEEGIQIPKKLAIAGFDDAGLARLMPVPLTTVAVPRRRIGVETARAILSRVEGIECNTPSIDVGFEIVFREST